MSAFAALTHPRCRKGAALAAKSVMLGSGVVAMAALRRGYLEWGATDAEAEMENVIGCDIHSADRIIPQWQGIAVGDEIRLDAQVSLVIEPTEAVSFVMSQKMLRGMKARAERATS